MKKWLIAIVGAVTCVASLGLLAAPVGAQTTSSTTVSDNSAGLVTGGTLIFTATVSGIVGTPTGTLTWTVTDPLGHAVPCADSTLDGTGQGTCAIASVIAGTYSGTANYGGDSNYDISTGSDTTATVGQAGSTTTVSDNAAGVKTGGSFTLTATVSGPGVTPTGTSHLDGHRPPGPRGPLRRLDARRSRPGYLCDRLCHRGHVLGDGKLRRRFQLPQQLGLGHHRHRGQSELHDDHDQQRRWREDRGQLHPHRHGVGTRRDPDGDVSPGRSPTPWATRSRAPTRRWMEPARVPARFSAPLRARTQRRQATAAIPTTTAARVRTQPPAQALPLPRRR